MCGVILLMSVLKLYYIVDLCFKTIALKLSIAAETLNLHLLFRNRASNVPSL